jgi:predicted aldo/keto reductase-like oxidoreductase
MSDRRHFLRVLGAAAATGAAVPLEARTTQAAAPSPAGTVPVAPPRRVTPDHYVTLGRTGMKVSKVAAGLSLKADDLVAAADAGVNYFDTAEKYLNGKHTEMVGVALRGRERKSIFISAKFQDGLQNELTATTEEIVARMHKCLERLGTSYVDCMLIHNVQRPEALTNPAWLRAYDVLKADGKVRFLGASTHDPKLPAIVGQIVENPRYDLLLLAYNPTTAGDLYGSPGWPDIPRLLDTAGKRNMAVSTMKIMVGAVAAGAVTGVGKEGYDPNDIAGRGKYLDARIAATRWVLHNPNVQVVQYTMTSPEVVAAAVEAATTPFSKKDSDLARAYHVAMTGRACPIPCPAPCLDACPVDVAIPDILHHRLYYEQFGLQKQAMLDYAALGPAGQAVACQTCASPACIRACPEGLPVFALLTASHDVLRLA